MPDIRKYIKQMIRPWRRLAGRFVIVDSYHNERYLRPIYLASEFVCAENVPGDYLEFGVFRGESFIAAYHAITNDVKDWASKDRAKMSFTDPSRAEQAFAEVIPNEIRYFAFDSFDGLSEPQGIDTLSARFAKGRYDCPEGEFRRILESRGVDLNQVITVPGFYEDSLTQAVKDTD